MQLQGTFKIDPVQGYQIKPAADTPGPEYPIKAAQAQLAEADRYCRAGNFDRARPICEALLDKHPDYVGALQLLGAILAAKKSYLQALPCLVRAAMLNPKDRGNLINLASVYLKLEATELAAQTLEQVRRLNPDDPEPHHALGKVYREGREYRLAIDCYRQALALRPAYPAAAYSLGECYESLGRVEEAAVALKQAHELKPESVNMLYAVSQLPAQLVEVDLLGALERVRKPDALNEADDFETTVAFTRAAALHQKGRYREAWECLMDANRREFPKHEAKFRKHLLRMEAARKTALAQPATGGAAASRREGYPLSLFIIGPSRSGKTTLEGLVSRLPGVTRGYESRLVERAARRASQDSGLLTLADPAALPPALNDLFRELYREELEEFAPGARIITCSHPAMIAYVGRIAAVIPEVRFLFLKRDPNDTALRILMKKYRSGNHYAYDLGTVFEHISWYHRMIDIWLEKFPRAAIGVDYQDMIADPASTLRRSAQLCGVAMQDGPLPMLGDDRGCAVPYREYMAAAKKRGDRIQFS